MLVYTLVFCMISDIIDISLHTFLHMVRITLLCGGAQHIQSTEVHMRTCDAVGVPGIVLQHIQQTSRQVENTLLWTVLFSTHINVYFRSYQRFSEFRLVEYLELGQKLYQGLLVKFLQ